MTKQRNICIFKERMSGLRGWECSGMVGLRGWEGLWDSSGMVGLTRDPGTPFSLHRDSRDGKYCGTAVVWWV